MGLGKLIKGIWGPRQRSPKMHNAPRRFAIIASLESDDRPHLACPECHEPVDSASYRCRRCGAELSEGDLLAAIERKNSARAKAFRRAAAMLILASLIGIALAGDRINQESATAYRHGSTSSDYEKAQRCLDSRTRGSEEAIQQLKSQLRVTDTFDLLQIKIIPSVQGEQGVIFDFWGDAGVGLARNRAEGKIDPDTCRVTRLRIIA